MAVERMRNCANVRSVVIFCCSILGGQSKRGVNPVMRRKVVYVIGRIIYQFASQGRSRMQARFHRKIRVIALFDKSTKKPNVKAHMRCPQEAFRKRRLNHRVKGGKIARAIILDARTTVSRTFVNEKSRTPF